MGCWSKMEIISIPNFYRVNFLHKLKINSILDKNYKKYVDFGKGYNYPIYDTYRDKFFRNLYSKFMNECRTIFGNFTLSQDNSQTCWCYRAEGEDFKSMFHDHLSTSTINSVYYHQVNRGDSITFRHNNTTKTHYVSDGELIIIPNYLAHKPDKPVKNRVRYSINMEIKCLEKSHQLFGR